MLEWMAANRRLVETSITVGKVIAYIASFSIPAWAASATVWMDAYRPFSWIAAGMAGVLTLSLAIFFYSLARRYLSYAKLVDLQTSVPMKANPLANSFGSTVIRLQDVRDPVIPQIQAKTFDRCTLLGPAVVTISGATAFLHCSMVNCDHIAIANNVQTFTAINLDGCNFNRCTLVNITFLIPVEAVPAIGFAAHWLNAMAIPAQASAQVKTSERSNPSDALDQNGKSSA